MGVPILDSDNVIPKCNHTNSSEKSDEKQKPLKDIVGNCKEFRIDCNRNNLRIIGNGNKIRINQNSGNLDIVGNDTRVKIMKNSGLIKYTGNSGRIYLGSDSSEQAVDYTGCNGILKVLSSADIKTNRGVFTNCQSGKCKPPSYSKFSSSSSSSSDTESGKKPATFRHLNIRNNISMPNLFDSDRNQRTANINNSINLSYSTGNIIIKNAINVAFSVL